MIRYPSRLTTILWLALWVALPAGVAASTLEASRGAWSGVVGESSSSWPATAAKIELRVEQDEKRSSVKLTGPDGGLFAGEFQTADRDAVFPPPPPSGLMAFILRIKQVNPLDGQPLVWARRTGTALIVYRLDINGGTYRLDRMALTPSGNRLMLDFERREHDRSPARFTARLERQGR